jgi:hypothetical protein
MPIQPFRPTMKGDLCSPFDCDEQALNALATVGAFVALADGRVETIESCGLPVTRTDNEKAKKIHDTTVGALSLGAQSKKYGRSYLLSLPLIP